MLLKKTACGIYFLLSLFLLISCSTENDDQIALSEQEEIMISHQLQLKQQDSQGKFALLTDATSIIIDIIGCTSGYRQSNLLIGNTDESFELRKNDTDCEVLIRSFVADGHVYLASTSDLNTSSWDTANLEIDFTENNGQAMAKVKVETPLAPAVDGGNVIFTFRTFDQGSSATNSFNQEGTTVSLSGTDVPNFKILEGDDLVINNIGVNGKATFDVVFDCQGVWVENGADSTCDGIEISNFDAQILDAGSKKDFATFDDAILDEGWVTVSDHGTDNYVSATLPAANAPLEDNLLMLVVLRYVNVNDKAYRWYYLQALPMSN